MEKTRTTYRLHVYGKGWVTSYIELDNEYGIGFGNLKDAIELDYSWKDVKLKKYLQNTYDSVTTELILGGSELLR